MVLLLVPVLYIVRQGPVPLGRLAELILFSTLFIALLMLLPMAQFNFIHLKPVGQEGLLTITGAAPRAFYAYLGYETLLVLFPFVQNRRKVYRLYFLAIFLAVVLYAGTAVMVYGVSGVEHTRQQIWPLMEYLATGRLLFIERIDNLFLFVMSAKIIGLVAVQYYAAAVTMAHITSKKLFSLWTLALLPVVYAIAFLPGHQYQVFQYAALLGTGGFVFIISLVLLLLLVAVIMGQDERKEEKGQ
jgi:spore germination protein (amino acid permease)